MRVENWNPEIITEQVEKKAMDRLEKAGRLVAARARAKCPVGVDVNFSGKWGKRKAGTLRDSIRVTRLKGDPKQNIRVYAGNREAFYARFVEYGTVKMKARPFMRPALNSSKADIKTIVENG